MEPETKKEITRISKEFFSGFEGTIDKIAGSGWLVVDPLSGYLNAIGYKNELHQIPATKENPMILIMEFEDGTQFIPAGSDLSFKFKNAPDWFWID